MKNILVTLSVLALLLLTGSDLYGQSRTRELGLRFSSLNDIRPDIVYKKSRKKENKFMRYRLGFAELDVRNSDFDINSVRGGVDFSIGWEKRKEITSNFTYFHGFEPTFTVAFINDFNFATLNLGYVFGFQYDISEHLGINIETVPGFSLITVSNLSNASFGGVASLNLNSHFATVTLVYTFKTGE